MNVKNYVKDHGMFLIIWALQAGIVESILWMFHAKLPVQIFVFVVQGIAVFGILFYDFSRKKTFYRDMEERLNTLEEKYFLLEMLKRPEFLEGELFYDTMVQMEKSMNDEISKITEEKQEYQEYVECFAHEIKIPIGALSLTFDNTKNYTLKKETDKIFQLVEQMPEP